MKLSVSGVNGTGPKVKDYLARALPDLEVVCSESPANGNVVAILEVSEFDDFKQLPQILDRAGRNISQAVGAGCVLCYVDRSPAIRWTNGDRW